jgi:hypothetical protein
MMGVKMATFHLYKYLSIDTPEKWIYRRQLIADREIYFSDPANFNDPLDCAIAQGNSALGALRSDLKVFCMCMEPRDDSLMFAHYGDSHKGFRLTFEVTTDKPIGDCSALELGEEVKYVNNLPTFDKNNIHRMLYTKSTSWAYEAEYRILAMQRNLAYPDDSLIEVAFGYRMNPDFEPVIRAWVNAGAHQRVRFVRAIPSATYIGFDYVAA